ncbi:PP2C family protein-serine/threonine phosphatase [Ilumatobacter sp.]|uniref:PP2C family protein-serine/threonine phosphatase n=1 Tax=Ilumatobacter sp. TaxID=1967498 RepID=UPI003C3327DF
MVDLTSVASARDFAGVLDALTETFGEDAALFAIDHAFDRMVEVRSTPGATTSFPLDGAMRAAMLENRPFVEDDLHWIPISDREHPVLVVRASPANLPSDEVVQLLGPITNAHRARFEDLERVRRRSSMSVAAEMQWASLPNRADLLGQYAIGSVLEPAYEVAGDAFDYATTDGALFAYSLDGMGHGVAATMASVLALSAIRNTRRSGGGLAAQMNAASAVLFEEFAGDCFVTGLAVRIDASGIEFVNAGHEPAWAVEGGEARCLDLTAELPLGVIADHAYGVQAGRALEPGDGIAMFSDGPANARSSDGSEFGSDRLHEALEDRWSTSPLRTAHGVVDDVIGFIQDERVSDDITAVVIRRVTSDR